MSTYVVPTVRQVGGQLLVVLASLLVSGAAAQADWPSTQTGAIDFELAGQSHTFYTYAIDIPENVAEGMAEGPVRDRLEAAAGTTENTATWHVDAPAVIGPVILSTPTEMQITLTARPTQDPNADLGQLIVHFSLSLSTLQLSDPERFPSLVRYYAEAYSFDDFYALTEGELVVTSVERVDDHTLRVQGGFEGAFSLQEQLGNMSHNPDDTMKVSATFDVRQVFGAQVLDEVLQAEGL